MPLERKELIERLKKLAQSETPQDLSSGAMCYSPIFDNRVIACIPCDHCEKGQVRLIIDPDHPFLREYHYLLDERVDRWERTLDKSLGNIFRQRCVQDPSYIEGTHAENPHEKIIDRYQRQLNLINQVGLSASLEIPEHCEKCGDGLDGQPFHVIIRFADDQNIHRVKIRSLAELDYFTLFLQNKDRHKSDIGIETHLQSYVPEILSFITEPSLPFLCDLFGIKSEYNALDDIGQWPQMKKLSLHSPVINDGWLKIIATMKQLEELDLSDCSGIQCVHLSNLPILGELSNLRILRMNRCKNLRNYDFGFVQRLKKLEVLSVSGYPKMHSEAVEIFATLSTLQELDVSYSDLIFDSTLRFLIPLQNLHTLNIVGCDNLTIGAVRHLRQIPNLRHLQASEKIKTAFEKYSRHD